MSKYHELRRTIKEGRDSEEVEIQKELKELMGSDRFNFWFRKHAYPLWVEGKHEEYMQVLKEKLEEWQKGDQNANI